MSKEMLVNKLSKLMAQVEDTEKLYCLYLFTTKFLSQSTESGKGGKRNE